MRKLCLSSISNTFITLMRQTSLSLVSIKQEFETGALGNIFLNTVSFHKTKNPKAMA